MDSSTNCVSVAVPVPLRQTFTYRVPDHLRELVVPGVRVAVRFGRRKVAGFVLGDAEIHPAIRLQDVGGILDDEPVFNEELLSFLVRSADYYMHPVGEVFRAAAPPMPAEALKRLKHVGVLSATETLPGSVLSKRVDTFCRIKRGEEPKRRLGARQQAIIDVLHEAGDDYVSLASLRARVSGARQAIASLEQRGLVEVEMREVRGDGFFDAEVPRDPGVIPNAAQRAAIDAVGRDVLAGQAATHLLYGVTGSGKTEVYLQVIKKVVEQGRSALVLVPEIALTPQLVGRFRARFGDDIAVLHSGMQGRARGETWRSVRSGRLRIVVGARSAVFAPVRDLGVIVVDEEHDPSFKQEEGFRYHARDMAMLRAHRAQAVCLLGSATPSLEIRFAADEGSISLLQLPERATSHSLPDVEVVDLTRYRKGPSGSREISAPLYRALEACLRGGGQAILFLNRRGFSRSIQCEACGDVVDCPACSVAMTFHRSEGRLRCHYCDHARALPQRCGICDSDQLREMGVGTEQLEHALTEAFPDARVGRLDRDVANDRGVERVLAELRRGEIDVLVGTQMVTKGHDFPRVTLVGVVLSGPKSRFC